MNQRFAAVFFLFCLAILPDAWGQVFDDFSDGDFTNNPAWVSSSGLFAVEPYVLDASNQVLKSNSPGAATYGIAVESSIVDDVFWSFFINLRFATSGANFVDAFLMADDTDLTAAQNGYFVRIGGTDDEISFYKLTNGTATLLIDGDDGVVGSSTNNPFNIRMSRTASGSWSLEVDQGATGIYGPAGSATDADIATTLAFGFRVTQSTAASAVGNHFFDNIEVAPIPVDETPPSLLSAVALSGNELLVNFSEPLGETSATSTGNYNVNLGLGAPLAANWSAGSPAAVTLEFGGDFQDGQLHTLSVSGVEDLSGNAMGAESVEFFYFIPATGIFKDIVFNELMPDPNPPVALPDAEYIELYNASTSFFDLSGWTLVNTTTERLLTGEVLPPGGYLILCNATDAPLFEPFGAVMGIASFSALSNAGDSLTLLNLQGDIIDLVSYTSAWYQDPEKDEGGYSLELINPDAACSGAANWRASDALQGGTPGQVNSIFDDTPDTEAPVITGFEVVNPSLVRLDFSEVMDENSLATGAYSWNSGINTLQASPSADLVSVTIAIDGALEAGPTYVLTVTGPADCSGNPLQADTEIQIEIGEIPELYDLLITEIMADPTPSVGLPEAEYFELYNASDKVLDLQGISLSGEVFVSPRLLQPGAYLLCSSTTTQVEFFNYPDAYFLPLSTTFFTNGGKELVLTNQNGVRVDRVNYALSWYGDDDKAEGGYSLERINLNEPCRGGDNWTGAAAPSGGTPGNENAAFDETPDSTPPEIEAVFVLGPQLIEVRFTEVVDSLSIILFDAVISPGIGVGAIENDPPAYQAMVISLLEPLQEGVAYSLVVQGVADCSGNTLGTSDPFPFGLPQQGLEGDLLINEVLFNPRTGGADFVEIVNVSDKIIGLQNWALQNQDFTTRTISENPQLIFPGKFLVFSSDVGNIAQEYPMGIRENYVEMSSLPSYNNSEGSVILADQDLNIIDRFDYLEDYHLQLLGDFKGVSLERISLTRPTNVADNWTSAAQTAGFATPGYINSQFNPEGRAQSTFELQNDVFSPDNDGFNDILLINYWLSIPGALATIQVFDRRGRMVKQLANNELLGTEGTITWDGVVENGGKARLGPHLLIIELFALGGQQETFKIPCIVAGRLSD